MAGNGRAIWMVTTIIFLITTLVFAYMALRYKGQAGKPQVTETLESASGSTADPNNSGESIEPKVVIPPPKLENTQSGWETENQAAPMANVPIYEIAPAGTGDPLLIELKTTVQWFVLIYEIPSGQGLKRPEILIKGPGDKMIWGAGPLPTMDPGSRKSIAIPGDYLHRGEHSLIVKDTDGENLIYTFNITRRRHPGEVTIGNQ